MTAISVPELYEKLPTKLKVGTQTYSIIAQPNLIFEEDNDKVNGLCEPQHLRIRLETNLPSSALVVDTLIHELLHAIWDERSLPKKPDEERAVRTLATGLLALFQDNPKLLDWIKKGLKK